MIVAQPDDTVNIVDLLLVTDVEIKPAANGCTKETRHVGVTRSLREFHPQLFHQKRPAIRRVFDQL